MKAKKDKIIEAPVLSLSAKVERLAVFLRSAAHGSQKKPSRALRKKVAHMSPINSIQQIAKILREEVHKVLKKKKAA
jgi:hypothetical protein